MDILVVNPNTTSSMTKKIGEAARSIALANTNIIAVNPKDGPPSIEGYFDEVFAIPGMIGEMQKHANAYACIIACFDDTGLDAGALRGNNACHRYWRGCLSYGEPNLGEIQCGNDPLPLCSGNRA